MINRVIIRSKVVQVAYSYFITKEKTIAEAEKELHHSLAKSYELYHALLQLMVELTDLQAQRIDAARNKYLPTEEDLNPNLRFVENHFIKMLRNNAQFVEFRKDKPFLWDAVAPDYLRRTLDTIVASDTYREYMNGPFNDKNIDCELWRVLFKTIIAPSDDLTETLENISLYWNEDLNTEATFVLKTIKQFRDTGEDAKLLPMYKDEDDKKFASALLRDTLSNETKYREYITRFTRNWEIDRIAFMDVVIMQCALAEILSFPNIPVSVSLNEYVEIAKVYSTPKSASFVNGTLDGIVNQLKKDGKLMKN